MSTPWRSPGWVPEVLSQQALKYGMVLVVGVNERDHGSLYNTQLVFDADGSIPLKRRRKMTPTYHERMIWGQGDGSGLKVVDTKVGRVGALGSLGALQPLARLLMAQHEEIHCAQFPRLHGRPHLPRPDRGHHQASCPGIRLFRGQCHRLAHR